MTIVWSGGTLAELPGLSSTPIMNVVSFNGFTGSYAAIYRSQPNVRTVISFLARNIAQLNLHVYERVSDTDRIRLTDHPLARLLKRPNPYTTRHRLFDSLMNDLGIWDNAFWYKIRKGDQMALLRIPPYLVQVKGSAVPTGYVLTIGREKREVAPQDVVHFRGFNPDSATVGLSPLETLRQILAEDFAASGFREQFWKNSARMGGILSRPENAPEWLDEDRQRFKAQWEALYTGAGAAGKTAILEEGMTFTPITMTMDDAQYIQARKLTREEVAAAFHVPPPSVGILENATYSNISEQHKQLYQDTLGPWLDLIEEEVVLQLLPDFEDGRDIYVEFNMQEKLKGSFEEQAQSFSSAVGAPFMTRNEVRARMNLPSIDSPEADNLVTPLNVLVGGQASPRDSAPPPKQLMPGRKAESDSTNLRLRDRHEEKWADVIKKFFERQQRVVEKRYRQEKAKGLKAEAVDDIFDSARWDRELAQDLYPLGMATATVFGDMVSKDFGETFDPALIEAWMLDNATIAAQKINSTTRDQLVAALAEEDKDEALKNLFIIAATSRALQIARSKVTTSANFGAGTAAEHAGVKTKTWKVNSGNPRSAHSSLSGVTIEMGMRFSNGMKWPGDYVGGADDLANCRCSIVFRREE